jgi:hypothetical protein
MLADREVLEHDAKLVFQSLALFFEYGRGFLTESAFEIRPLDNRDGCSFWAFTR